MLLLVIYKIQNKINGKIYIGQTSKGPSKRIAEHVNNQTSLIGKALRKYGFESFDITIIDETDIKEILNEKEIYWIEFYNSLPPNGYNISTGGDGGNLGPLVNKKIGDSCRGEKNGFYGHKHKPESIEATRSKNIGRKQSKEQVADRIAKVTGRKNTEETLQKMRKPHGPFTEEQKQNMRGPKSEETKEKNRQWHLGRKNPRVSVFDRRTGSKQSKETVEKRKQSLRKFYDNKKLLELEGGI